MLAGLLTAMADENAQFLSASKAPYQQSCFKLARYVTTVVQLLAHGVSGAFAKLRK